MVQKEFNPVLLEGFFCCLELYGLDHMMMSLDNKTGNWIIYSVVWTINQKYGSYDDEFGQ